MSSREGTVGLVPPGGQRSHERDLEGSDAWASVPIQTPQPLEFDQGAPADRPTRRRRLLFLAGVTAAVLTALSAVILLSSAHARRSALAGAAYEVRFLVVGDWGRQGGENQTEVAAAMARLAERWPVDFVVSTGDNFYKSGLKGVDDPAFDSTFTNVYSMQSLQVPWHAVLGNHDYCDSATGCDSARGCPFSPLHQLNLSLTNRDPRWHCERSYRHLAAGGSVELFMIDTTPAIARYFNTADPDNSFVHCSGGLLQQSWPAQLLELEHRLNRSMAEWKIIVGHHPPYSNGEHGNNTDVAAALDPLIWRYGVQAYLAGHDHNLEALRVWRQPGGQRGQHYAVLVSGAGSKTQRGQFGSAQSAWFYPWSGFAAVSITPRQLTAEFYTLESSEPAWTERIERGAALEDWAPA